jgi:transposase
MASCGASALGCRGAICRRSTVSGWRSISASDAVRASLHEAGIRSCIPPKTNRKAKIRWNRRMYRERNRIERMIGHLKINRAIVTRYDKLARFFLDALHIAAIRRCLRYATL